MNITAGSLSRAASEGESGSPPYTVGLLRARAAQTIFAIAGRLLIVGITPVVPAGGNYVAPISQSMK